MKSILVTVLAVLVVCPAGGYTQDATVVYAVGDNSTVLQLVDGSWQPIFRGGVDVPLAAVWESPGGVVYAVGEWGTILRIDEGGWSQMASGVTRHLKDIWGFGEDDIYTVGFMGTILHYDGFAWSEMASGTETNFYSIWGLSAGNLYAGGYGNLILHYDGSSWGEDYSDGAASGILEMWGAAPDDVYAFGSGSSCFHYDGAAWSAVTVPMSWVKGTWGTASDDIYACCNDGIHHYNGKKWQAMESCGDGTEAYEDIWGASGSDIHAVGGQIEICNYDGSAWTSVPSPYEGSLYGVFGRSADDVWAVGSDGAVLHYDGAQWELVLGDLPGCGFRRIWGSAADDIYVTGCGTELMHFDGVSWQGTTIPGVDPYIASLKDIDGTGPDNVYVVGGWGDSFGTYGTAFHFDGSAWSEIPANVCLLTDVWADPGGGFYARGACWDHLDRVYYYYIYHYLNGAWTSERTTYGMYNDEAYYRVGGCGTNRPIVTGYASMPGFAGYAIHIKDESGWDLLPQHVPCSPYIYNFEFCPYWPTEWHGVWSWPDLWDLPVTDVWFCGAEGKVVNWTPNASAEFDTGTGFLLRAIWGSSNMEIYAVGDYGVIVSFHNGIWNVMDSGTTSDLYDIWGMVESAVATLLHSFSVEVQRSRVLIRWSLADYDPGTAFRVTRTSRGGSSPAFVDEDPALERDARSFTYLDHKVTPGDAYSYLVEQADGARWRILFGTGPVTVPMVSIALEPNYPNPFNPVTTITYSVFERGRVTLRIYDVTGRLVRILFDDEQAPGAHVIQWNGLDDRGHPVSSGTYFCRLTAGKESASHKILLVR